METHDFTTAKVGDKVSHPMFGFGEVFKIDQTPMPIYVKFKHANLAFAKNGKIWDSDISPSLYHGHNTFEIIATPVSPYKVGEWIAVWATGIKKWEIEAFVGIDGDFVCTINGQYSIHKSLTELNAELNNK